MNINFLAPVTINVIAFVAAPREAAPIIEQPPQPAQIAAPDNSRLYMPDVQARADELYQRPYYLSITQRREIAAQLDAKR